MKQQKLEQNQRIVSHPAIEQDVQIPQFQQPVDLSSASEAHNLKHISSKPIQTPLQKLGQDHMKVMQNLQMIKQQHRSKMRDFGEKHSELLLNHFKNQPSQMKKVQMLFKQSRFQEQDIFGLDESQQMSSIKMDSSYQMHHSVNNIIIELDIESDPFNPDNQFQGSNEFNLSQRTSEYGRRVLGNDSQIDQQSQRIQSNQFDMFPRDSHPEDHHPEDQYLNHDSKTEYNKKKKTYGRGKRQRDVNHHDNRHDTYQNDNRNSNNNGNRQYQNQYNNQPSNNDQNQFQKPQNKSYGRGSKNKSQQEQEQAEDFGNGARKNYGRGKR